MPIGDKLDGLIKNRHTNVNQLSIATGISPSTIYGIIRRNNTKVDLDVLQSIADALNVPLDYFLSKSHVAINTNLMYFALDDHGKQLVDAVLKIEYDRCTQK